MDPATNPSVPFVYYTYTQQARRVTEAMMAALRSEGCEVTEVGIEFTDKRYAAMFERFPMKHAFLDVLRMLPAQLRRATGENRERFHGVKIPPTNLQPGFEDSAAEFARGLVASVKAPTA